MKKNKKNLLRVLCLIVATVSLGSFSGCAETLDAILQGFLEATKVEYGENDWNPDTDGVMDGATSDGGSSDSGTSDDPEPDTPDITKEVLRSETDTMGHKIVYYTDGSKEDLGRAVALNFAPTAPDSKYGYHYFSTLDNGAELCSLYNDLYRVALGFHNSQKNAVAVNGNYELADFRYSDYGLTKDEATGVWRTVAMEYPEFFWWSNSLLVGNREMTMLADGNYALASTRMQAQALIEEIVKECDTYLDGTTTLVERALTVHDYIVSEMDYAYQADGYTPEEELWAHNIAGIATHKKGVCEAYAKTYDYLCGFFGLETLTVVGEALQDGTRIGHAWNLVYLDGKWHALDATWNDCGAQGVSREWWGMGKTEFSQTHIANTPADGWGVDYQFALPDEISENYLSPTRIYATGEEDSVLYATVEDAILTTETGKNYRVALYPETAVTEKTGLLIVGRGATLNQTNFTANGEITLVGRYDYYDGGYYALATLHAPNGLTLQQNLTLEDVAFFGKTLSLGACTLKATGSAVELYADGTITGESGSLLQSQTSSWTALGKADLYAVSAEGKECRLEGGGKVQKTEIHNGVFRLYGAESVSLGTVWFASNSVRLYIDGANAETNIAITELSMNGVFGISKQATVYLVYTSVEDYPVLSVNSLNSTNVYLALVSQTTHPALLGKSLINIGDISYSKFTVGYSLGGNLQTVTSYFQKDGSGNIVAK